MPAVAAAAGDNRKHRRYGDDVSTLAYEVYGRLAPASIEELRATATTVARHARFLGRHSGRGLYGRWRLELERALLKEEASTILLCLGRRAMGAAVSRPDFKGAPAATHIEANC